MNKVDYWTHAGVYSAFIHINLHLAKLLIMGVGAQSTLGGQDIFR